MSAKFIKIYKWLGLISICLFFLPILQAQEASVGDGSRTRAEAIYSDIKNGTIVNHKNMFDIEAATIELNNKIVKLSIQDVVAQDLERAAEEISQMKQRALKCVENNFSAIEKITAIIPKVDPNKSVTLTPSQQVLIRNRIKAVNLVSECKVFILKADEAIIAFNATAQKIKKTRIFGKKPPLVSDLPNIPNYVETWLEQIDTKKISKNLGLATYQTNEFNFLLFVTLAGVLLGALGWKNLNILTKRIKVDSHFDNVALNLILVFKRYSIQFCMLTFLFVSTWLFDFYHETSTIISSLFGVMIIYYLSKGLINFCFLPPSPAIPYCDISKSVALKLNFRINLFFCVCLICVLAYMILYDANTEQDFYDLLSGVIITFLACNIFSILWVISSAPKFLNKQKILRAVFSSLIAFVLFVIIISQWIGYQEFASYLLLSTAYSILLIFSIWFLYSVFSNALDSFTSRKYKWENDLQKFLQITEGETPIEVTLLRLFGFLLFWSSIVLILNDIWSLSEWWSYQINMGFFDGFIVADSKIMPFRIILSLFVLAIGMLSIRAVRQVMNSKIEGSRTAQEAHIMILSYVFYTAIMLFTLVVAGINLGGLALVAGALSVGIGFGLQGIVNNFVSGLILLLERPIKKGDRIIVGGKEGFVAKIGLRSTRVNTIEKTDVIVPNAELISNQVTNFMYNNKKWLIIVKVGVEYGSDVALVKKLMLQVALDNSNTINTGHEAPAVFFMNFGDNALDFELWTVSINVNDKFFVLTDLNSEIDRVFKENDIVISFPQTDLHIKDSVPLALLNKNKDSS